MKVKVCGITNIEDARMVLSHARVHAIGFIINVPVDTPRKISLEKAASIVEGLGEGTRKIVAVMMPSRMKEVEEVYEVLKPDAFQFHGKETPLFIARVRNTLGVEVIKTIHVSSEGEVDWEYIDEVSDVADYLLLDTKADGRVGGTGIPHDWNLSLRVKEKTGKRIILSGGLSKDNVVEAVKKVGPHWIDVSSSLEHAPGRKDPVKVSEFLEALKDAR